MAAPRKVEWTARAERPTARRVSVSLSVGCAYAPQEHEHGSLWLALVNLLVGADVDEQHPAVPFEEQEDHTVVVVHTEGPAAA